MQTTYCDSGNEVHPEQCDIFARHAQAIVGEVKQAVTNWKAFAGGAHLDKRSTEIIAQLLGSCLLEGNQHNVWLRRNEMHPTRRDLKTPTLLLHKIFQVDTWDIEMLAYIWNFGGFAFELFLSDDRSTFHLGAGDYERISNWRSSKPLLLTNEALEMRYLE